MSNNNSYILITGGSGFIGSHVCLMLLNSGYEKFDKGNFKGAIMDSTKAIEIDPKYEEAYFLRANAYFQNPKGNPRKNLKSAIDDYSKVIEIVPYNADAYFNRG